MNLRSFWQLSSLTFALVGASHLLAPTVQAHHDPVHSAQETVTQTVSSAQETVTQTVSSPDTTLPLALGSTLLLGTAAAGSYFVFKRRSI